MVDLKKAAEHASIAENRYGWEREYWNPSEQPKQKREWVGLTDEEMRALKQKSVDDGMTRIVSDFEYIRSIEAKLKEKNGG